MKELLNIISKLKGSDVKTQVETRLDEFNKLNEEDNAKWFSELCFCILTSNSRADTALTIQKELGVGGFHDCNMNAISRCIRNNKHRFHNVKAKFIVEARKHSRIKSIMVDNAEPREWLVKNIKGVGYKEASHFLRNVGYQNFAIIDRHIINLLLEHNLINEKPKTLNKKQYLKIERILAKIALKSRMSLAELDLYMWYAKTGKVLK